MDSVWQDSYVRALVEISDEEAGPRAPSTEVAEDYAGFGRWQRPSIRQEDAVRKTPSKDRYSVLSNLQDIAKSPGLRQAMAVQVGIAVLRKRPEILIPRKSLLTKEPPQQIAPPMRPLAPEALSQARRRFEVVVPHSLAAKSGPPPSTSKPRKRIPLPTDLLKKPTLVRTASLANIVVGSRVLSPPADKPSWTLRLRSHASHSLLPLNPNLKDRASL